MVDESEEAYREKLRSIDASMAHARQYLDRTAPHYPEHWSLPRAFWQKTDGPLELAAEGQRRCGDRAIFEVEYGNMYAPPSVLRYPVTCQRPAGHDGLHASAVRRTGIRKSHWQALVWSSNRPIESIRAPAT